MARSSQNGTRTASRERLSTDQGHTSTVHLIVVFLSWKLLLLLTAIASPGPGYDSSTEILFRRNTQSADSWLEYLAIRLTRWDGLYFASASESGLLFEQQWAFSPFLARVTSMIAGVSHSLAYQPPIVRHALVGITISHVAHLVAVILLYRLTYIILSDAYQRKQQIAFTAACLHTISPAGLFLSAPYGESAFAMFNFAGLLCYAHASQSLHQPGIASATTSFAWTIASGLLIGIATMIRSNGLFGGFMFACDVVAFLPSLSSVLRQHDWSTLVRVSSTILAGVLIAIGYIGPQVFAYIEYCTGGNERIWCHRTIPSIYSFVQSHYWDVGFLHYWTTSNLPLFTLATPMLAMLVGTGYIALHPTQLNTFASAVTASVKPEGSGSGDVFRHTMRRFALPQVVLAVLAFTSFHVQIINRISSGYPVWYILLAIAIRANTSEMRLGVGALNFLQSNAELLARTCVIYAIVQGGLYASFLPPA
ncbi:Putative GPI mannosyltransferase 2 [Septoria linicola]|uniref:GPI mannosyltransferase 2 n=1 Tax=Septoria linicola TaxID=215465 RepID=A0A9Q9EJ18_9PEZI|nr:putative GPI mannosyltransferase 2 [Septoria linicola]USW52590.1 Putative GPI mannosyltransferase 2 [Septoria linicola]